MRVSNQLLNPINDTMRNGMLTTSEIVNNLWQNSIIVNIYTTLVFAFIVIRKYLQLK